ncbi:hypothetical protein L380_00878 [Enterobacter roggenkampii MGH 34]|nr:hypothetical protein L380_00878 [Enterobacter roggenkampii MGH 34]
MVRITHPLTNNEILKTKPREKDFTLHDGTVCSYSSKHLEKSYGASETDVR